MSFAKLLNYLIIDLLTVKGASLESGSISLPFKKKLALPKFLKQLGKLLLLVLLVG